MFGLPSPRRGVSHVNQPARRRPTFGPGAAPLLSSSTATPQTNNVSEYVKAAPDNWHTRSLDLSRQITWRMNYISTSATVYSGCHGKGLTLSEVYNEKVFNFTDFQSNFHSFHITVRCTKLINQRHYTGKNFKKIIICFGFNGTRYPIFKSLSAPKHGISESDMLVTWIIKNMKQNYGLAKYDDVCWHREKFFKSFRFLQFNLKKC